MILIDGLTSYGARGYWCHCACETQDDLETLHHFIENIGGQQSWFQDHHLVPHYDLTPRMRRAAIREGAQPVNTFDFLRRCRRNK